MSPFFKKKHIDETFDEQKNEFLQSMKNLGVHLEIQDDCDVLNNVSGEFGKSLYNPIPVNGTFGELKYLHRLCCQCKQSLYFHRIGSKKNHLIEGEIDIYETVCYGGLHWDILYFHMYHPRRTKKIPLGYYFSEFHHHFSRIPVVIGTNRFVPDFPFSLSSYVKELFAPHMEYFINKILEEHENSMKNHPEKFVRPDTHKIKLKEASDNLAGYLT